VSGENTANTEVGAGHGCVPCRKQGGHTHTHTHTAPMTKCIISTLLNLHWKSRGVVQLRVCGAVCVTTSHVVFLPD